MTDYVKTTNFLAKDSLISGDPNKLIKGSEHDTEYNNIATASATKANKVSSPTTNDLAMLSSTGDLVDSSISTDGAGTINSPTIATPTITSPNISTPTITTPTITGGTINGVSARGFVILATPQLIVNSTTVNTDILMDMSVQYAQAATDGAIAAFCSVVHADTSTSPITFTRLTAHSSPTFGNNIYQKSGESNSDDGTIAASSTCGGSFIVVLDSNSDFYWRNQVSSTIGSTSIYLVGYMV